MLHARRLPVALLLVLALALRLGYVAASDATPLQGDAAAYDRLAQGVAATGAYPNVDGRPTAYRSPALPYLLGGVDALSGSRHRLAADRVVLALVGAVAVALVGLLAAEWLGTTAGLVALALAAVYPPWITTGTALLSEPLFLTLELAALLAVTRARGALVAGVAGRGLAWAAAAGALAGLLWLTRANGAVLLPALLAGLWLAPGRSRRAAALPAVVALAGAALVLAPWMVRDAVVLHRLVLVSDESGGTLLGTYNGASAHDQVNPAGWRPLGAVPPDDRIRRALMRRSEVDFQSDLQADAVAYAGAHPTYPLVVAGHNLLRLLDLHGLAQTRRTAPASGLRGSVWPVVDAAAFWVLALLAGLGVARGAGRRLPRHVWVAGLLLVGSELLVSVETPRFRLPLEPWVLLPAASAVVALSRRGGARLTLRARLRRVPEPR